MADPVELAVHVNIAMARDVEVLVEDEHGQEGRGTVVSKWIIPELASRKASPETHGKRSSVGFELSDGTRWRVEDVTEFRRP